MSTDSDNRAQIYLTVLKHCNLDVDWKAFMSELGISNTSNAQRKFRDTLKKDGFQLSGGKVIPLGESGKAKNAAAIASKKRKGRDDEVPPSTKKAKKSKQRTLDENGDESVDGEKEEEE